MSIEPDDLHRPLGLSTGRGKPFRPGFRQLACALLLGAGVAALSFLARDSDHVGEPYAVAKIAPAAPVASIAKPTQDDASSPQQRLAASGPEVESDSGVTVIRPGGGSAPDAMVIRVPDSTGPIKLAAAPDPRLVERGEYGPLPRVGQDGSRPAKVYARPAPPPAKGRPRIAIVVGGLGLNDQTTATAIAKLPGEISLAFAPYGANIKAQAAKARESGHEILLQMPMEPFDYPQNNPGPQTLTTDAGAAQNLDKLHWAMARASGFIGIENFLGARFTADEAAITPILRDIGQRGLIFLDDGSSARSIAPAIGASLNIGVRRSDIVIDAAANATMIDAALGRLESLARDKGLATASASALPVTLERLSAWAATLGDRGIDLVPISATVNFRAKT